jgi:hypothetical protein
VTGTTIGLMLYIYIITDRLQKQNTFEGRKAAAIAFFNEVAAKKGTERPDTSETIEGEPENQSDALLEWLADDDTEAKSVRAQMIEAIHNTNPVFQPIMLMLAKLYSVEFGIGRDILVPLNKQNLLVQLDEFRAIAIYQYRLEDNFTNERDFQKLEKFFRRCFAGKSQGDVPIRKDIDFLNTFNFAELSDNNFSEIVHGLIKCWAKLVLSNDGRMYMEDLPIINSATILFLQAQRDLLKES